MVLYGNFSTYKKNAKDGRGPSGSESISLECRGFSKVHPGMNNIVGKNIIDKKYLPATKNACLEQ